MPNVTFSTVSQGADCEAIKRLRKHHGVPYMEQNVWGAPEALAEMQRQSDVRIAPVTVIDEKAFHRPFNDQRPRILAALRMGAV